MLPPFAAGNKPVWGSLGKDQDENRKRRMHKCLRRASFDWLLLRISDISAQFNKQAGPHGPGGSASHG
jgi:hypothetical protein